MMEHPAWQEGMRRNEELGALQPQANESCCRPRSGRTGKRQVAWPPPPGLSAQAEELRDG
jgi:hypothetical protein